jgi:hypothetical protein
MSAILYMTVILPGTISWCHEGVHSKAWSQTAMM